MPFLLKSMRLYAIPSLFSSVTKHFYSMSYLFSSEPCYSKASLNSSLLFLHIA
nr:MAG TPA: hypothetical protein [Caudoviricetes sp.]